MSTIPRNVPAAAPLEYESRAGRPRRSFLTPVGWFALSAFCFVYVAVGWFKRRAGAFTPGEWVFLAFMGFVIAASLALGIGSARRRRRRRA